MNASSWFSWRKPQTWVFFRVLGTVLLFVILALWFQHYQCPACDPPHCANEENNHQQGWIRWVCRMIDNPEAVFALALVFCNALFFAYLSRQLFQTEESNRQTTRSVDVLIEIERVRVELDALHLEPPTNGELAEIRVMFLNAGRTTATSVERGINVQLLDPTAIILDAPVGSAFGVNQERMPVPPGEQYGYEAARHIEGSVLSVNASAQIDAVRRGRLRLFVQGYVRYEVITGVRACNWFTYLYMPDMNRFILDPGCAFNGHCIETPTQRPVFQ